MGSLRSVSVLKGDLCPYTPTKIHRIFETVASSEKKSKTAIIYEEPPKIQQYSYESLNNTSNKLARAIIKFIKTNSISPNNDGDFIVSVCMTPSDKLVMTLLAIWKAGGAYLPIDVTFPNSRVQHILKEAKPALVIYETDFDFSNQVLAKTVSELFEESCSYSSENITDKESLKSEKDNLAIVLYTSGSTGVPKGVRIPHEAIQNRLFWQFKKFPYSDTEKVCVFKTALTFVDSVSEIWGPLLNGRAVLVIPKRIVQDPDRLVEMLHTYQIERLVLVPSLLRSLLLYLELKKDENLLSSLKIWVCSGEPLPVHLAQDFFKYFPAKNNHVLCNFYGSTEIMGDVTYHVIDSLEQTKLYDKVPIGVPLDNTVIYLLNPELQPVEVGSVGELWVAGDNLAAGYVNGRDPDRFVPNPLATSNPQLNRMYRTGDYARLVNGRIIYEGRTDSQVKIRGHRVDLSEVEKAVLSLPVVDKAVVLCYHAGEIDQALLAFVTLKDNCLVNEIQVENMLQGKLAEYMQPQVIILENIPLLVNGKTDRQALLKSYENTNNNDDCEVQVDIDYNDIPEHQMLAARILLETVASVLNRSARGTVNIHSNFYEIGGNSLNSIYTITKLNEQGYYINISDFIQAANLQEVLNHLSPEKHILPSKNIETPKYSFEMLSDKHKKDVIEMITDSFYEKADLEQWLYPDIHRGDYPVLLEAIWSSLLEHDISFLAYSEPEHLPVGVALNFDARNEPEVEIDSKLGIIFEFLEFVEGPIRDEKLPPGKGKIFHCSMMGTNSKLDARENISVMQYMEEEVLRIARAKNYAGIFTTNTSPLTQQLGNDVYGYQNMLDYQVNKYVAPDGTKPFGKAPDSQRAIVSWKPI